MLRWLKQKSRTPGAARAPTEDPTGPRVTLRWLLGLSGSLSDGSNESIRFRENVESPNIRLGELRDWCAEALEDPTDPQRLYALQDLVNSLGYRLGFQVEFGSYDVANADWMVFDGLWRVNESLYLATEVFSTRLERIDFKRLQADLALLDRNPAIHGADTVACFVLCQGADPNIEDDIRTSSLHDRIRLLPLATLFDLLRMDQEGVLERKQLPVLLRPFSPVGVHRLLGFLEQFLGSYESDPGSFEERADPEAPVKPPPPKAPDVSLESAREAWREGDRPRARERLSAYLGAHADDPAAWELAGDWAHMEGDLEGAIQAYRKALSREPAREGAAAQVAALLRERGEYHSALEVLDDAGGLTASARLLLERAETLLHMNEAELAEEAAQAAHASNAGLPALRLLARAREAASDPDGAAAVYERILELEPEDAESRRRLEALRADSNVKSLPRTG